MSKINILHLMNSFSDSSISRIVLRLIENIEMEDVCWHVGGFSDHDSVKDIFSRLDVQTIDFSESGLKGIRQYLLSNNIKIVHTHTPRTILMASLALTGVPNVEHLATKHLLTRSDDRKWGDLFAMLDRLSLYLPARLIPVSATMYKQIIDQPGLKADRVTMIRNAIPNEQFYIPEQRNLCREELGFSSDSIVLGYTGRIQKVKQLNLLIDAFSRINTAYPNARLLIVGDGEEKTGLESYAVKLGISDKVVWTGFRSDIPRILAAMDIYIQTSLNEGLSLSILEAMAAGKPVVATDVGGNSEIIKHEISGLLIKNTSPSEIADAVLRLLNRSELRVRLALAGLELVQRDFSLNSMVMGYQDLYKSVLSEKK